MKPLFEDKGWTLNEIYDKIDGEYYYLVVAMFMVIFTVTLLIIQIWIAIEWIKYFLS